MRHFGVVFVAAVVSVVSVSAQFAWVEGESPVTPPTVVESEEFPAGAVRVGTAWGNTDIISDGEMLAINLSARDAEAHLEPGAGLTFVYRLEAPVGGRQELWARIGYEWVRAPLRWRVDGGDWTVLGSDVPTVDVMPLQTWNELAWIKLGDVTAGPGSVTVEIDWPRTSQGEGDKARTQRILGILDALCLAPAGVFQPAGLLKPDQDHRGADEHAAREQVFALPGAAVAGARAAVALTGSWETANWDENVTNPLDRLAPVRQLPDLDALRWFAYTVPGDRNAQYPEYAFHHRFLARCRAAVPASLSGRSFVLDIERFNTIASVFVNGVFCGWSKAHSTAMQVDCTAAVRPGQVNELVVVFKDRYYALNGDDNPRGWRGFWNLPGEFLSTNQGVCSHYEMTVASDPTAGITEPATFRAVGAAYVADAFVRTSVERRELAVDLALRNPGTTPRTVTIRCEALPWQTEGGAGAVEHALDPVTVTIPAGGTGQTTVRGPWPEPTLWWPDRPHLYVLRTTLLDKGASMDVQRTRFGFREWGWDSHMFRINGVEWQMWSDIDSNFSRPDVCVEQARKSGQNTVRLWRNGGLGGWTRERTLDYFDETGMCVRSSGVFDGQMANYGGGLREDVDGKRRAKKILFDNWRHQMAAWIRAERNHPSVYIWSVENEITYINVNNLGQAREVEPAIRDAILEVVMTVDPTRPAMVDGGNALRDESLPVNGAHYTEFYNCHWRDLPDACYTRDHWYDPENKSRNAWRMVPDRPIMKGEVYFASGYTTQRFATIGGEACFVGMGETRPARGLLGRIFSEGWRWGEVAAWQFWLGGGDYDYWQAWQPVAVLSRQWATTFGPEQKVTRDLRVFNNTSTGGPITARWTVRLPNGHMAGADREFSLAPGAEADWRVRWPVPTVTEPMTGTFALTARRGNEEVYRDERPIRILVPDRLPKPDIDGASLAVYDPRGSVTEYLTRRGIAHTVCPDIDTVPATARVLVIGSDAIPAERAGDPLWYSRALQGLRVLVLDQRHPLRYRALPADVEPLDEAPSVWARMQAEAAGTEAELRGRYGFSEDLTHPVFAGLTQTDFFTWGNDHVVYRNPYRKGTRGHRSLFQCEEGLSATALVECRPGDGLMVLSQLAIGEKLAHEAVAQQVFAQMLNYVCAYEPTRRPIRAAVAADSPLADLLGDIGVQHQLVTDPRAATSADGIAVVAATPANLKALAARADAVRTWCETGNWLMLCGVDPEGLSDFNRLVQWQHVMRPFDTERVLLATPRDPLSAGLTLRDVVMDTGQKMYGWMALLKPDSDAFTYVVDHMDIAPFCTFPKPTELGKSSDDNPGVDHWPRNMVNGFTSDDNWAFCYTVIMDRGHAAKWTLKLPQEEEITAVKIRPSRIYHPLTKLKVYFDDDPTPVVGELRVDPVDQEISFPPRRATRVTMEIAEWAERGNRNIVVVDNIWLQVKRPESYRARVKSLLNIGGLMRYSFGQGGIVLNQVNVLKDEVNPANVAKKRTIFRSLLANMGAVLAGDRPVVAGSQLACHPVAIPDSRFNAYVRHDREPGWFDGPGDLTAMPVGEQTYGGVRFRLSDFTTSPVPSVFMLRGKGSTVKDDRISGITVGRRADALFVLHTYNRSERDMANRERRQANRSRRRQPVENLQVFTYRVHYADGESVDIPVRWQREIDHWVQQAPESLPGASLAWTGPLAEADGGERAAVYVMQWTNPRPDAVIETVEIVAGEQRFGAPAVLAITTATLKE